MQERITPDVFTPDVLAGMVKRGEAIPVGKGAVQVLLNPDPEKLRALAEEIGKRVEEARRAEAEKEAAAYAKWHREGPHFFR